MDLERLLGVDLKAALVRWAKNLVSANVTLSPKLYDFRVTRGTWHRWLQVAADLNGCASAMRQPQRNAQHIGWV